MNQNTSIFEIDEMCIKDINDVLKISTSEPIENWTFEGYQSELINPDSIHLVIKYNQTIIGFLVGRLIMNYENNSGKKETEAEIYNIAIQKKYQRRGLGKQLIEKIVQYLNPSKIFLEVRASNTKAINFYLKIGFLITGRRKNFYNNPIEDALLMNLNSHSNNQVFIKTLD